MAAPLRSTIPGQPKSMQFAHFGVLDTGTQSKSSTLVSLFLNAIVAVVVIVISAAAAKQTIDNNRRLTNLVAPVIEKKPEPVKPKVVPPKPKLPEVVKIEEPKLVIPKIKPLEAPKQPVVKMDQPKPILLAPPAPKQVIAVAAPKIVNLGRPEAASVPNHDPQPSAVGLGHPDSPIPSLHGPAVSPVNMGQGFPGMNSANSGHGPPATKVVLGNGSPQSTSIKGNGVVAVAGIPHGVPGGTGTGPAHAADHVNLGQSKLPPMSKPATVASAVQRTSPKVIYKPRPEYTAEAKQLHIEGTVTIHIRVLATGAVQIVNVVSGLGHGLDDSAKQAILATKFEPATDTSGNPITWDGVVNVAFQLAG